MSGPRQALEGQNRAARAVRPAFTNALYGVNLQRRRAAGIGDDQPVGAGAIHRDGLAALGEEVDGGGAMQCQRVRGHDAFQLRRGLAEIDEQLHLIGALQQGPRFKPIDVDVEKFFGKGEILSQ
jgi:hypothetical protein